MITIGWIWLLLAAFGSLGSCVCAGLGGTEKTAWMCAFDAVEQALLAAWIYFAVLHT